MLYLCRLQGGGIPPAAKRSAKASRGRSPLKSRPCGPGSFGGVGGDKPRPYTPPRIHDGVTDGRAPMERVGGDKPRPYTPPRIHTA